MWTCWCALVFILDCMMLFLWNAVIFYTRCNRTQTFQNVHLSVVSTQYFPKGLGDHQNGFWQTSLFGLQWFSPWNSPVDAQSLFIVILYTSYLILTEVSEACSSLGDFLGGFCDLLVELPMCSWSNRLATMGKVHYCSKFSPFVDESQSLRNGLVTLSS